jgi:hypothetical protein
VIPEEKAALIVWRIMVPSVPFEDFERHLLKHRRPEWNQAVRLIADEMREYAEAVFQERAEQLALAQTANMIDQIDEQLAGLEVGLEQLLAEVDDEESQEEAPTVARALEATPW